MDRIDEAFLPATSTEELFLNRGDSGLTVTLGFDETDIVQELLVGLRYGRNSALESLFLDPPCLAAWLRFSLVGKPLAPTSTDLEAWVAEGIALANVDPTLNQAAAEQMFVLAVRKLTVGQLGSDKALVDARRAAEAAVAKDPEIYQRGKDRAKCVLGHVRGKLDKSLEGGVSPLVPCCRRSRRRGRAGRRGTRRRRWSRTATGRARARSRARG